METKYLEDALKLFCFNHSINDSNIVHHRTIITTNTDIPDSKTCQRHLIIKNDVNSSYTYEFWSGKGNVGELQTCTPLRTLHEVNDILIHFISDSYYNSPIIFNSMEKSPITDQEICQYKNKHNGYFYMGNFINNNTQSRVFIKPAEPDNGYGCDYEYIVEEIH